MDNSRDRDLYLLNRRMNDWSLPRITRKRAWRTFNSILAQMRDRKLVELRHRLIRAKLAGDQDAAENIEFAIEEHSRRCHY